jgi:hypothetical protein
VTAWVLVAAVDRVLSYFSATQLHTHIRWIDFALLLAGGALWCAVAKWILEKSGSALPSVVLKRLGWNHRSTD